MNAGQVDDNEEPLIPFVSDGERGTRFPDTGAMHEPRPYTGPLDWQDDSHDHLHPFVD